MQELGVPSTVSKLATRRKFLERAGGVVASGTLIAQGIAGAKETEETVLVRGGQAEGSIVIGKGNRKFCRWVASELQRYLRLLTGADFQIVTAGEIPSQGVRILVGGPETNELTAAAQQQKLVGFAGLKQDGFLLKTVSLQGKRALVVGGNDDGSTMYAAYELLERLGAVFQITGDIVPEQNPNLRLPELNVRMEPALKCRGLHVRHFTMPWMGLDYFRQFIDQLAKMKCNYLEFFCYVGAPWVEYSYRGEKKLIGDLYTKESGYTAWHYDTATFTPMDVTIGKEHFSERRACAPEFQDVKTPEEAYRAARQLLKQVIHYAHERNIQIWLGMGDCPGVPPNLGRFARIKRWHPFFGTLIPAGDPVGVEIWKAAMDSMIQTYPEADGYWLWLAETYFKSDDADTKEVISRYKQYRTLIPSIEEIRKMGYDPTSEEDIDSDFGLVHYGKELIETLRLKHPSAQLGIAVLGRAYLFRVLDALIPKDIAFSSMESSACWRNGDSKVPMELFAGMGQRKLWVVPRLDDDESELGMQFNLSYARNSASRLAGIQFPVGWRRMAMIQISPQSNSIHGYFPDSVASQ